MAAKKTNGKGKKLYIFKSSFGSRGLFEEGGSEAGDELKSGVLRCE